MSKKIDLTPNKTFARISVERFGDSVSYPEKIPQDHDFSMPLPRRRNVFSAPSLEENSMQPARADAEEHKKYKSKGF